MFDENTRILVSLCTTLVLIGISGCFVAVEFAIVRVRRTRLEELASQGSKVALIALKIVDNLSEYLATTQIGITAASLGVGWFGENAFAHLFDLLLPSHARLGLLTHAVAVSMAFILITAMHVILGELVPKLLAIDRSERLILLAARPLQIVHFAFRPAQRLFTAISLWLIRRTGAQSQAVPPITESELKLLLEDSHDDGVISKGEIDIIIRALAFADKKASDIMVPADRIDYLSLDRDFAQNLDVARLHRHSRLPLCMSGLDTVIGVVNMKDAWPTLLAEKSNFAFEKVARELVKLPLTLPQDAILRLFKERHSQIGIVRDNGDQHTLGVVTLEDVLESLIGDVRDQGQPPRTTLNR